MTGSSSCAAPARSLGFTMFDEISVCVTERLSYSVFVHGHVGGVLAAGIHPSGYERQDLVSLCNGMYQCKD